MSAHTPIVLIALALLGGLMPLQARSQTTQAAPGVASDPSRQGYGMGYANRQLEPARSPASAAAGEPKASTPVRRTERQADRQAIAPMASRGHGGGRRGGR